MELFIANSGVASAAAGNVAGAATGAGDGSNSKRKLDLAHSTNSHMTVLSMDSQSKVRRRGTSLSSNDSTVMKRSHSDGTINERVCSDASDSEVDTDDGGGPSNAASCPISPSSTSSDSVNEATAQLRAMSPRESIPVSTVRTSPFSPVFASPSRMTSMTHVAGGSARNSPLPSPFYPSPARRFGASMPASPEQEQVQQRMSAPAAFSLGIAASPARTSPTGPANASSGGRGSGSVAKRSWQPTRRGRNPGNLSLDLSQMEAPASATGDDHVCQRRTDQAAVCSQVTDFLYIGGAAAAKDRDNLVRAGITHIINCAANIAPAFYPDEFQYYNIKLRDHSGQDIARYFYNVFDFIEKARRRGGKVFVHCVKGISRSPTMAIAYLMWYKGVGMAKALDFVRQARPAVDPNTGFIFQLNEWELLRPGGKLNLLHPVVFQIGVSGGSNGTGNGARAAEKPLVIGPLTSITEAELSRPSTETTQSCFIVSSADYVFLWCGPLASEVLIEAAQHAITLLQTYESFPEKYEIVTSGHENPRFWSVLEAQQPHRSG